jgi:hypothetical protein
MRNNGVPGIRNETVKIVQKMRNTHCRNWIMAINLKNMEKGQKRFMTWNMARNTEKREKREMHIVGLEYGEKIKKRGK